MFMKYGGRVDLGSKMNELDFDDPDRGQDILERFFAIRAKLDI